MRGGVSSVPRASQSSGVWGYSSIQLLSKYTWWSHGATQVYSSMYHYKQMLLIKQFNRLSSTYKYKIHSTAICKTTTTVVKILCQVVWNNVKISHDFYHIFCNFAGSVIKALDSHIVAGKGAGEGISHHRATNEEINRKSYLLHRYWLECLESRHNCFQFYVVSGGL